MLKVPKIIEYLRENYKQSSNPGINNTFEADGDGVRMFSV